ALDDVLAVSSHTLCPTCQGSGLNPKVLASKINDLNIAEYNQLDLTEIHKELLNIKDPIGESIARQVITQINKLVELVLVYLRLSSKMNTVSSGEAQRVKIARHLGSSLNNLTYIIDEPRAGLHPEEIDKLKLMLKNLKAAYNTVVVIEHHISI